MPAAPARLVRAPEASRYLGLAPATLAKLRCIGGGPPFIKMGRAVVYSIEDLRLWVQAKGKRTSTAPGAWEHDHAS